MNLTAEFQILFRALEPYRAVADLKLPITTTPYGFTVPHPKSGETLIITPTGLVAEDPSSSFVAGDVFDFLAEYHDSYPAAVKYVLEKYPDLADNPFGMNLAGAQEYLAESLILRRRRFLHITCLRENLAASPHRFSDAVLWLRSKGVEPESILYSAYAASGQQLLQIFADKAFSSEAVHFNPCDQYIVLPFFLDYHLHGTVQFMNVMSELDIQSVDLNGGMGFFGLPSCRPGQPVQVFADVNHCIAAHNVLERNAYNGTGAVTLLTGFRESHHPQLREGTFVLGQEPEDLPKLVIFRRAFEKFNITLNTLMDHQPTAVIAWHDYLRNALSEAMQLEGGLGPNTITLIDCLRPDKIACQHLLEWFGQQNNPKLFNRIKSRLSRGQCYVCGGVEISETPLGYNLYRVNQKQHVHITNFTLRIERNLWFPEDNELFYQGHLIMGNQEYPISLPEKVTSSAPSAIHLFESLATAAVLRQKQSSASLPCIIDTSSRKRIGEIIRHQSSPAPSVVGVKRLGWDRRHQKFITPFWQATALGVSQTSQNGYPGSDLLSHYTFQIPTMQADYSEVNHQARVVMALLANLVARSWADQPLPVIQMENSRTAEYLLRALFLTFGQVKAMNLFISKSRVNEGYLQHGYGQELSGYPIFGQRRNAETVVFATTPTFLLDPVGVPYTTPMTDALYNQIYSLAHQVVTQLTVGLLRDNMVLKWEPIPATLGALVAEGRAIIKRYCMVGQFETFSDDLPLVRAFLSEIPRTQVQEYFHIDPASNQVLLNMQMMPGYTRVELARELKKIIPETTLLPAPSRYYISMPIEPAITLLTEFYGESVKVFFGNRSQQDTDKTLVDLPSLPAPKSIDKV